MLAISLHGTAQNATHEVIYLYKGKAPGSENVTWDEVEVKNTKSTSIFNVIKPNLTVFEADKSIDTREAVIICPGGGFRSLAIEKEGYNVAK